MAPQPKTVGGGAATGLSNDFIGMLRQGLTTGSFGNPAQQQGQANPVGSTNDAAAGMNTSVAGGQPSPGTPQGGPAGFYNSVLGQGAGNLGGSLQTLLDQSNTRNIADMRARYSMGGTGTGTPAMQAESLYRSQAAPQAALGIGNLQMQALNPLMAMMGQLSQKGIPQATTVMQQNPWMTALQAGAGLAGGVAGLMKGVPSFGGGGGGGSATPMATGPATMGNMGNAGMNLDPASMMQMMQALGIQ